MPSKIRVLSEHTINKIAAGEVIENPSSVVKELVENSLDAGSSFICIEIKGGGRQMIRISDNGCGMNGDDALLCLERHATSKIREVEEIHTLSTMGFRGEAIPSIASISKFTLLTAPQLDVNEQPDNSSTGTLLMVDGGKIISCTSAVRDPGTTIEVKTLFFNVPVRKKFLKSPTIDSNEILKIVSLIALSHPQVKFQLINDGKTLLMASIPSEHLNEEEKFKSRISDVLGQDFLHNTTFIHNKKDAIEVKGVVGIPSYTRHNRTGQHLFINKRAVISPLVSYAVKDGFGTSLAHNRYPVFVLNLTVPGDFVDVNVHPQKREVRLRQEQLIRELITKAVHLSLQSSLPHEEFTLEKKFQSSPAFSQAVYASTSEESPQIESEAWIFKPKTFSPPSQNYYQPSAETKFTQVISSHSSLPVGGPRQEVSTQPSLLSTTESSRMMPKVLTTITRYILLDASSVTHLNSSESLRSGIILVDQKAAHARIIFEKISKQDSLHTLAQQTLLIPYQIEVSPLNSEIVRESLPLLNKLGIHIQEFGSHSFLVDAIPQIFGNTDIEKLVKDILNGICEASHGLREEKILYKERANQIAMIASRSAVSNERRLSFEEAKSLIHQLMDCETLSMCPAGKPIFLHLSTEVIAKLFQNERNLWISPNA